MDTQNSGHLPQVFELPAGTRYAVIPPHPIGPELAAQLSEALRDTEDPRTLVFGEPGWTIHVIPAPLDIQPLEGARLMTALRELARRFPRNVQLDPAAL